MRLDGALEPRPRQGAATFKGRQPLRRESREPCETQQQQQQQPADEDDEATDAECLTTNSSKRSSNNCKANLVSNPKRTPPAKSTPTPTPTLTPRKTTGGRGNSRHTILMAPNVGHQRKSLGLRLPMKQGGSRRRMMGAEWGWERLNGLLLCLISVVALLPPLTLGDDGDNFFAVNAFSAGPETTTPEFAPRKLEPYSKARWRENRTIFNTPNPRLMNVSLLRDSKLLHGQERRGSRMSVRAPSRQPSMASLRPHSPNPSLGRMIRSKSNTRSSDSRVSDVSTCSRLLEHPSAASQHNLVHSHFLPYVPTTTASTATNATNATATYAASATPSPTPTPPPSAGHQLPMAHANATSTTNTAISTATATATTTTTTTYVCPAGTAPACGSHSESHGSNASAASVRSNRSNSVAPGKVVHHERHGSAHRQHHPHGHQPKEQPQSPQSQDQSLITNITTNPVAESVTVEIIEPGQK
uniref:GG12031 n=1 Tax=Drosophila erecta TaxID=7220 RepID=B3P5J8_DROER